MNDLPISPENIDSFFYSAEVIKAGAIREVRKSGDIFLKFDRRKNHDFKKEFNNAKALESCGIPVVKHLFFTKSKRGNFLATKAFDGISVDVYLKNHYPGKDFFFKAAQLSGRLLKAGFIHTDFHMGNLLYSEKNDSFVLVDVDKIIKLPAIFQWLVPQMEKLHLLTEFKAFLDKKTLFELFSAAGITDLENFYQRMFIRSADAIRKNWKKRAVQIISGYKKFTVMHNGILYSSEFFENIPEKTEIIPNGEKLFLASFFLDIIGIPHRKAVSFNPADKSAVFTVCNQDAVSEKYAGEMITRLKFYGIDTDICDWKKGKGVLPELYALEKIAAEKFIITGEFD